MSMPCPQELLNLSKSSQFNVILESITGNSLALVKLIDIHVFHFLMVMGYTQFFFRMVINPNIVVSLRDTQISSFIDTAMAV